MALSPDLVVGYSGNEEALAPVQNAGAPVLIFNPKTLEQIYANITTVGAATGATGKAAEAGRFDQGPDQGGHRRRRGHRRFSQGLLRARQHPLDRRPGLLRR